MRIHILLLLVFATKTLSRSRYRRNISGISFSDSASVSTGLNGIDGQFKKDINLKGPRNLFDVFGLGEKSNKSKDTNLSLNGGIKFKPKLSLDKDNGGLGISLTGSGGLGFGISHKDGSHKEKENSIKHDKSKQSHKFTNKSDITEWHEKRYRKNDRLWREHDVSAGEIGLSSKHRGKNSYWEEGDVIIIPILEGDYSNDATREVSRNNNDQIQLITKNKTNKGGKNDINIGGIILFPYEDKRKFNGTLNNSINVHSNDSKSNEHRYNQDGKKNDIASIHIDQHKKHQNDYNESKERQGSFEKNEAKNVEKNIREKEGKGNGYSEKNTNIILSHNGGKPDTGNKKQNSNSHVKGGNTDNKGKEKNTTYQKDNVENGKHDRKENENSNGHDDKTHNIDSHVKNEDNDKKKGSVNYQQSNRNNGTHVVSNGSVVIPTNKEDSNKHKKNDIHLSNCNKILNNRKYGNITETLTFIKIFIQGCEAIIHYLSVLTENDLRSLLCHVLPRDNKLSCHLGCNIFRVRPIFKPA